ncbi:MAG TPA: zinc-ribbon domain-containing protein, partial [Pyrinomonadaceae bacterium]
MIVTCPNCTTRLQLDGAKVPARPFSVRCPKCQQIVNAQPPAPATPQRDAVTAVGDVPASARPRQETAATVAAPVL